MVRNLSNAGDLGLIPGSGRSPGEGNGYPLQYSCLENPMDRGAWWASPWGCKESKMTERLTFSLLRVKIPFPRVSKTPRKVFQDSFFKKLT